jgi:hypothetical protein
VPANTPDPELNAGHELVAPVVTSSPALSLTQVLQGRVAVRDALIDFAEPERSFGASARDNPIRRADHCNAFLVRDDAGPASPGAVVQPESGGDTADPPIEYQIDVTELVNSWLEGNAPNHGLAIAPVIDPIVDEGLLTRFQLYASEYSRKEFTPKLMIQQQ